MSPELLILSHDATEYASLLADLEAGGLPIQLATSVDALPARAVEAQVALGEPGLLEAALPELPALEWIQSTWAGVTPLIPAARNGLTVTGIKNVFGPQMAEYALGFMLAHALDLDGRREAQARGEWLDQPTGTLHGRRLGVMGTGSIGAEVARRCAGFGMTPVGFSRSGRDRDPFEQVFAPPALHEFLSGLDVLVTVLPDTPETTGLLDAQALRALPAHAQLINVGRGNVIVDDDLLTVLGAGHLGEVVLDVFQHEPLPGGHGFWSAPRLRMTGHVAARSWPRDIAAIFRNNLERFRLGQPLAYRFDPDRGY